MFCLNLNSSWGQKTNEIFRTNSGRGGWDGQNVVGESLLEQAPFSVCQTIEEG